MATANKMNTVDCNIVSDFTKAAISFCWVAPLLGIKEAITLIDLDNPANLVWKLLRTITRYGQAGPPAPANAAGSTMHPSDSTAIKNATNIPVNIGNTGRSDQKAAVIEHHLISPEHNVSIQIPTDQTVSLVETGWGPISETHT